MPRDRTQRDIEEKLSRFLKKSAGTAPRRTADLIATGIVSSFIMLEFIDWIEREFKVSVDIAALDPRTFNTIERIARHIRTWASK